MRKAIFGHPDSGERWKTHCDTVLTRAGWTRCPEWPIVYWNSELRLLLQVDADDFKMAGPTGNMEKGWQTIKDDLELADIRPASAYLDREHVELQGQVDKKPVRGDTIQDANLHGVLREGL
jgi:hypothetical protein